MPGCFIPNLSNSLTPEERGAQSQRDYEYLSFTQVNITRTHCWGREPQRRPLHTLQCSPLKGNIAYESSQDHTQTEMIIMDETFVTEPSIMGDHIVWSARYTLKNEVSFGS